MASPALFLDKDGTLVEDVPYNIDPARIRLLPGAREALALLAARGWKLILISNQPGVALNLFAPAALERVSQRLAELLHPVPLTGFYYCPHAPEAGCTCRKPHDGLLREAARVHGIDLAASWMVGDILNDVEAGHRAGCRSILLDTGGETEWLVSPARIPDLYLTCWADLVPALEAFAEGGNHVAAPLA